MSRAWARGTSPEVLQYYAGVVFSCGEWMVRSNDWRTTDRKVASLEEGKTMVEAMYALDTH